MQVGQPMLQLLLYQKARSEQTKIIPENDVSEALKNDAEKVITSEDYKIADEFAMENINPQKKILGADANDLVLNTQAITLSSLSAAELFKIKKVIYDLHHQPTSSTSPTEPQTPTVSTGTEFNFIRDFNDIDTMFAYVHRINPSVTADTGISANAMWQLTQRDDWEESNYNFFGNLNKNFAVIDADNDGVLTKDELSNFLGDEVATAAQYLNKVEKYSEDLQRNFRSMTANQKLQFAINKAREYFEAVGLTEQLQSLDRLIRENKIGIKNLNQGKTYGPGVAWTLGSYNSWVDADGEWISDDPDCFGDGSYVDDTIGLWLDKYYYCDRNDSTWYEFVDTLVHELTHATASFHKTDESAWGEYIAYQTSEDYLDSIGYGSWSGSEEKDEIHEHIDTYYNTGGDTEPIPAFKWWTYGNYA